MQVENNQSMINFTEKIHWVGQITLKSVIIVAVHVDKLLFNAVYLKIIINLLFSIRIRRTTRLKLLMIFSTKCSKCQQSFSLTSCFCEIWHAAILKRVTILCFIIYFLITHYACKQILKLITQQSIIKTKQHYVCKTK